MKQNKNKNITKITNGALVLLLASGCLIGNSKAEETEPVLAEGKDVKIQEKDTESKPANLNDIGKDIKPEKPAESPKENKAEKPAEQPKQNSENDNKPAQPNQKDQNQPELNKTNEDIENKKEILKTKLAELTKYFANNAVFKESFKKKAEDAHTKYTNLLTNATPTSKQLQDAIDDISNLIAVEANNNLLSEEVKNEKIEDLETDKTGKNSKPSENTTATDGNANAGSTTGSGNINSEVNSGSKPGQTDTKPSTEDKSGSNVTNQPTVPGEKDNKKSVVIKGKIAGEINKFKALLKDGSWTEESLKLANAKITELEKNLLKSDLTEKDLEDVKASLNDLQINVLKKTAPKAQRKATNNVVIRNNSNNVKTGVESLASVLVTLSSSSFALFASKKRK